MIYPKYNNFRTISNIKLLDYNSDSFTFKVTVSSGTYIRSLCEDVAEKLGTIGYMKELEDNNSDLE